MPFMQVICDSVRQDKPQRYLNVHFIRKASDFALAVSLVNGDYFSRVNGRDTQQ